MKPVDARAWVMWLMAGGLLAILISNPLYLLLLFLISRLVMFACAPAEPQRFPLPFWRIAAAILVFSTLFNMLTAHIGQTVLFTLPTSWPLVGGSLTFEAAVYGFLNGLRLVTLLSFFIAFNTIVPVSELAGLTPRALHELGLVMLISITYIPETISQFHRIRDAQAIRGHQLNGLRAWRPILLPLLISGLERAMNLSETMVSRGYGSTSQIAAPFRARVLLIIGLTFALGGSLRLTWGGADGWLLLSAGLAAIAWAYRELSKDVKRTRYKPRHWGLSETFITIGAIIALIPILPLDIFDRTAFYYAPYPEVSAPLFGVGTGLVMLGLAMPAVVMIFTPSELELTH